MCRSTDFPAFRAAADNRMKVHGFYTRFSFIQNYPFPDSLTLLYLPRMSESFFEINGSRIRPENPAFLTLHRVVSSTGSERGGCVTYGSRDRVVAVEDLRFEVYVGEEKVLKGVFRRNEYGKWAMECRCALETAVMFGSGAEAQVCVAAEGEAAMVQRVGLGLEKRRKQGRRFSGLEEIPEEHEMEDECEGWCRFSRGDGDTADDGGGDREEWEVEVNTEGVGWAVDVGIWVMCVGVGILVSKASARRFRRVGLV